MSMLQRRMKPEDNVPARKVAVGPNSVALTSRAIAKRSNESLEGLLNQIQLHESTKLYPRLALFEGLSNCKDKPALRERTTDATCDLRRDFLDSFAYLCDFQKGGSTVTASALQKSFGKVYLWLAANEGIRPDVSTYAKRLLSSLKEVTAENRSTKEDIIFNLAIEKCEPRLIFYRAEVKKYAVKCRMSLKYRKQSEIVQRLRRKLKKLQAPLNITLADLVDFCYDMRDTEYDNIKGFVSSYGEDFSHLAHFVWRLGATRMNTNKVVEAMVAIPLLRKISDIIPISAPRIVEKSIDPCCMSPHELLHGIFDESAFQNPTDYERTFTKLHQHDRPLARPIHSHLKSRGCFMTRVHAELQIADKFSRSSNIDFAENDKYIGCSKPACYFCYNWLRFHKHFYVQPATHHKIIPGCRAPDSGLNQTEANVILQMYSKISRQIGQDIVEFLKEEAQPRRHYMSTEAPSRAVDLLSGAYD